MPILGALGAIASRAFRSASAAFSAFADNFNRSTSGGLFTSSSGKAWQALKGTWFADGNAAKTTDAASTYPIAMVEMTKPDVTASISTGSTVTISTSGTVGSISSGPISGFFTATITGMSSTTGMSVGQYISATNGTGSLYGGTPDYVEIISIDSSTQITYRTKGGTTPTAGTVSNIQTRSNDGGPGIAVWITDSGNWWGVTYGRSTDTACNCNTCQTSYCNTYTNYASQYCGGYTNYAAYSITAYTNYSTYACISNYANYQTNCATYGTVATTTTANYAGYCATYKTNLAGTQANYTTSCATYKTNLAGTVRNYGFYCSSTGYYSAYVYEYRVYTNTDCAGWSYTSGSIQCAAGWKFTGVNVYFTASPLKFYTACVGYSTTPLDTYTQLYSTSCNTYATNLSSYTQLYSTSCNTWQNAISSYTQNYGTQCTTYNTSLVSYTCATYGLYVAPQATSWSVSYAPSCSGGTYTAYAPACSNTTYGYVTCSCQTCYPPYIALIQSSSNAVTEATRWSLGTMAAAIKVVTNSITKVITIRAYKDKAMTSQIGSDLTYTATNATISNKFGIVLNSSDYIQGSQLDDLDISSN